MMNKNGIDISVYQGDIDFKKLKDNVDFVMIRIGYGKGKYDSKAVKNIEGCKTNNIPFGGYWFSYALTPEMATAEADYICDMMDNYTPTYPICFDYEGDSYNNAVKNNCKPDKQMLQAIATAFCSRVEERGYYAMIYTNIDFWNRGFGALSSKYDIWLAQWKVSKPSKNCGIWQKSSAGNVSGIDGKVDLDIAYKDYPVIINNMNKKKKQNTKEEKKKKEEAKNVELNNFKEETWNSYLSLAKDVIAGKWGNGQARKRALNNSGFDYSVAQKIVDIIMKYGN